MDFKYLNNEDLPESIEYWDSVMIEEATDHMSDSIVEALVHPNTGTAARIMKHEDSYSVQPVMGDFGRFNNVIQPDDPTELVSGWSSVAAMDLVDIESARMIAYGWITGWHQRTNTTGNDPGDVYEG